MNFLFMIFIMFLPILLLIVFNLLIVCKRIRDDVNLKKSNTNARNNKKQALKLNDQRVGKKCERKFAKIAVRQWTRKPARLKYSTKMTRILLILSSSYAILNVPYLITWCLLIVQSFQNQLDPERRKQLYFASQITELFNILNYSLQFYLYYLTGRFFRRQLRKRIAGKHNI